MLALEVSERNVTKTILHLFTLMREPRRWFAIVLVVLPASAAAETSTQLWFSAVLGRQPSERFYMEVEIQPKTQVSGGERWRNIDATWEAEYYPNNWVDLTGELVTGFTEQTDSESSFELTPKVGLRFHFVRQSLQASVFRENLLINRLPLNRFYMATWVRMEYRNFFYSGDLESSHEWRLRIRPEFKLALNNPSLADDQTLFVRGDVEYFVPLGDEVPERFTNKLRFRLGPGYMLNAGRRVELLFMYDKNRESSLADFKEDAFMVDLRLTFLF